MALFSLQIGLGGVNLFLIYFFGAGRGEGGGRYSPVLVHRLLIAVASVIAEHRF